LLNVLLQLANKNGNLKKNYLVRSKYEWGWLQEDILTHGEKLFLYSPDSDFLYCDNLRHICIIPMTHDTAKRHVNNILLNAIGNYKPLLNQVPEGIKACIMHKGVRPAFSRT
jgi:hypothetical protein